MLGVGTSLLAGYAAVLFAMERAPVSYVVAARSTGIVAGALAGALLLRERPGLPRWAAIAMIAVGVYCVGAD